MDAAVSAATRQLWHGSDRRALGVRVRRARARGRFRDADGSGRICSGHSMNAAAIGTPTLREDQLKLGLWLFLATVTMLFAAFTSAYIVRRSGTDWRAVAL